MPVYIINFLEALKKCLIVTSPKHIISPTIKGNVVDIIYLGEQEAHTEFTPHCATYGVWLGLLLIAPYLAANAKRLDIPDLTDVICILHEGS